MSTHVQKPSAHLSHGEPHMRQVRVGAAKLCAAALPRSELETEVLFGHTVNVLGKLENMVRVRSLLDGYEGWMNASDLTDTLFEPTDRVCVPHTVALRGLAVQSSTALYLGMNSYVRVVEEREAFVKILGAGWVHASHVAPIAVRARDYVEVALQFLGRPYGWGHCTGLALDCSALVQMSLLAAGIHAPRNASQQMGLGDPVVVEEGFSNLRRGDLAFWKGHVGIVLDEGLFLHATAYGMQVVMEPFQKVVDRYQHKENKLLLTVRRFSEYRQS